MNLVSVIRKKLASDENTTGNGRYERKFVVKKFDIRQLESILMLHPAMFREKFKKRKINNIYLDTPAMNSYFGNVYGNAARMKVRIRWYGNTFGPVERPVLELKIKNGLAGKKMSFELNQFTLDKNFNRDTLKSLLDHKDIPEWTKTELASYQPVLLNSYFRKYFVSDDKKIRITLDEGMTYYQASPQNNSFIRKHEDKDSLIIEMKYTLDNAFVASDISQHFPMRMTKSSKYVNGIDIFYPQLAT